jgi:hypothetical protein
VGHPCPNSYSPDPTFRSRLEDLSIEAEVTVWHVGGPQPREQSAAAQGATQDVGAMGLRLAGA